MALRGPREDYRKAESAKRKHRRGQWPGQEFWEGAAPSRGHQGGLRPPHGAAKRTPGTCEFWTGAEFFPTTPKGLLQARLRAKYVSRVTDSHSSIRLVCGNWKSRAPTEAPIEKYYRGAKAE